MRTLHIFLLYFILPLGLFAQFEQAEHSHQVIDPKVAIPIEFMKNDLIGKKISPFMANDMEGKQHYSGAYKGKEMLLFIWNNKCTRCLDIAEYLSELITEKLKVVSIFDESKEDFTRYSTGRSIQIPVIANGKFLTQGAYVGELGYPRLFFIDKTGIVREILDQNNFESETSFKTLIQESIEKSF